MVGTMAQQRLLAYVPQMPADSDENIAEKNMVGNSIQRRLLEE